MIVEPTPTNPRSPVRRALRLAGLGLPVVLLAGVAAAGLLGSAPAGPPLGSGAPLEAAASSPAAAPDASAEARPAEPTLAPGVPETLAGLRVRSVSATLDGRGAIGGPSVVAVAGHLRSGRDPASACAVDAGLPGASCAREIVIAASGDAAQGGATFGGIGAHIHAVVPPGVLLPGDAGGPRTGPGGGFGRFGASDAGCTADMRGCVDPFTVERVAWVDGLVAPLLPAAERSIALPPTDPMITDTPQATLSALGPTTTLLRALLLVDGLETVDPAAALAVRDWARAPDAGAVWYLRALDVPAGPPAGPFKGLRHPQVRWAVVSERTRRVIAAGIVPGVDSAAHPGG
jgi:hypothetical protein